MGTRDEEMEKGNNTDIINIYKALAANMLAHRVVYSARSDDGGR